MRHAVHRWAYVRPGKDKPKKCKQVCGPCEKCPDEDKAYFGCGFDDRYRDKATCQAAPDSTWTSTRTCPEFFARSPLVASLFELLTDYKRGALGSVLDLPISAHDCLQTLEAEMSTLEATAYDD